MLDLLPHLGNAVRTWPVFSHFRFSQEFIAFLMDGIHEDVNRVLQKPFTETVEGTEFESDEAAAEEAWSRHLQRNQSIIVDKFQGLLRSSVTCPQCDKKYVLYC